MNAKRKYATLTRKLPKGFDGKRWRYETVITQVEVMAMKGTWAMVRHKGCAPFVTSAKSLSTGVTVNATQEGER